MSNDIFTTKVLYNSLLINELLYIERHGLCNVAKGSTAREGPTKLDATLGCQRIFIKDMMSW